MPLNEIEINQLQSAMQILNQFTGMPQFNWVNDMLPKLQQDMTIKTRYKQIISFDANQYLKGIEHLSTLYNSISFRTVLNINYQDFKYAPLPCFTPPLLSETIQQPLVFVWVNVGNGNPHWNLVLDRIKQIEPAKGKFVTDKTNWEEYFDDVIGVTAPKDAPIKEVVLHFTGDTGKYIVNKPLHGSQKAKWLDSSLLIVSMKLKINYELERLILSYTGSVQVIKPSGLREKIVSKLKQGTKVNLK